MCPVEINKIFNIGLESIVAMENEESSQLLGDTI